MPRKRLYPEFPATFGEYTTELREPIVRGTPPYGLLVDANQIRCFQEEDGKRIGHTLLRKVQLLCAHFGVEWNDPNKWFKLSILLACVHVPGMQIVDTPRRERGAPPGPRKALRKIGSLDPSDQFSFVRQVNEIKAEQKTGISEAIGKLKKQHRQKYPETESGVRHG